MSRHLGVLRRAGIVEESAEEEDARVRTYRLAREPFSEIRTWLDEVEALWGDQLASFKAHVEQKHGKAQLPPVKRRGSGRGHA